MELVDDKSIYPIAENPSETDTYDGGHIITFVPQMAEPNLMTTVSEDEAYLQHFKWCAAAFAKQEELSLAKERRKGGQQLTRVDMDQLAPMPLLVWTRNSVEIYVAVMDSFKERVDVLTERRFTLDADDPESLMRTVNALVQVMNWGYTEYLPWFKQLIGEKYFE